MNARKLFMGVLFVLYVELVFLLLVRVTAPEAEMPAAAAIDSHHGPCTGSLIEADGLTDAQRSEFMARMAGSTVSIHVDRYTTDKGLNGYSGTGTIVSGTGYILTAKHVITNAVSVSVGFNKVSVNGYDIEEGRIEPAVVVAVSKKYDAALLKITNLNMSLANAMPIDLAWRPEKGEVVWYAGKTTRWGRGRIASGQKTSGGDTDEIEIDVQAYFGDSGGPLVSRDGKLVGILNTINHDRWSTTFVPVYVLQKDLLGKIRE